MTHGRTFAYCRVSTIEQTIENQVHAIKKAGYDIAPHRVVAETISGSCQAMKREQFRLLIEHKMEPGDTLVILKMDRLGRDMIDIMTTLDLLFSRKLHVISMDLGNIDLASPAGKLQVQVMAAMAEFERNRIRERTREGMDRARSQGKEIGRPVAFKTTVQVQDCKHRQLSQTKTAAELGLSLATVKRHWNKTG